MTLEDKRSKVRELIGSHRTDGEDPLAKQELRQAIRNLSGSIRPNSDERSLRYEISQLVDPDPRDYHDEPVPFTEDELKYLEVSLIEARAQV